jgi:hypothetical protein
MLLLTNDSELKDSVAEALSGLGGVSHLNVMPAMQLASPIREL